MAFNFLEVGECTICGRKARNFFLDSFEFEDINGEKLTGVYCWLCSFRYDRYNKLLRRDALVLGGEDEQRVGGK